ncbi:MAG: SDR family NAD(P)-dependent oxidoreductase [Alphaproteobacteria bacterium]
MDAKGQTAIVTGAAQGLGAATARALAEAGAKVGIIDLKAEPLEVLAVEIGASAAPCDVSEAGAMEAAIAKLREANGPARIAVACAGIAVGELIVNREGEPSPLEGFSRTLAVNLGGTYNLIRLAASDMVGLSPLADGERGVIVTTTSIAAFEGQMGQSAYSASKGGVAALTLPAARELARHGIRVNCIAPGLFETGMLRGLPDKVQDSLLDMTVFPKRVGQPEEYAALVRHLIGNAIINGETIRLDGAIRLGMK